MNTKANSIYTMLISSVLLLIFNLAVAQDKPKRPENGKYIILDNTKIKLDLGDLTETHYKNDAARRQKKGKRNATNEKSLDKYSSGIYSLVIEDLEERNYLDTSDTFFPNFKNSVKLDIHIESLHIDYIDKMESNYPVPEGFFYLELEVVYELKSYFGVSLEKSTLKGNSEYAYREISLDEAIDDEILKTLDEFIESQGVQARITSEGVFDIVDEDSFSPIAVNSRSSNGKLSDWRDATVTVIAGEGHGSGCVISSDGYIITNYHVMEQNQSARIIFMNGEELQASVVRFNPSCDLMLLKVEKSGLNYLQPEKNPDLKLGDEVLVIGTPADTLLGQSVSKGIVSGSRSYNDFIYIQTDADVNPGNSGGALVTTDGRLVGIVNAKYSGYGIEGIGFAIPASNIFDHLKIEVKEARPISKPADTAPKPKKKVK